MNYLGNALSFFDNSPTSYQATENIENRLLESGFCRLCEKKSWQLEKNKKYYVKRNDSALIAFHIGDGELAEEGFKIIGAHTDSPALKLKVHNDKMENGYATCGVEVYGGAIYSTWLDRELGIAGRIIRKDKEKLVSELFDSKQPLALIPNVAIHLNREVNKGFEINPQNHLRAVLSLEENEKPLLSYLKKQTGWDEIVGYDLFLYDAAKAAIINNTWLVAGRLDDLAMCHAMLEAICSTQYRQATRVAAFYDNEEIGSMTRQGADSTFLSVTLERIAKEQSKEDYYRALAHSFLISADMAHAVHPNFRDKHDAAYAPVLNQGPVVKINASYRYATTAKTAAVFGEICRKAESPYQTIISRSDIPSGSTIGPMTSAFMGIKAVDIGNPMWAMHSIRETMGLLDHQYLLKVFQTFYNSK